MRKVLSALLFSALFSLSALAQLANPVPASLNMPGTQLGVTSAAQNVVITNVGNATLSSIVISVTGTNSGDFSVTTTPATNCGGSLAVNATCTLATTFAPGGSGSRTANISIASNVATVLVPLTGTGLSVVSPGGTPSEFYNTAPAAGTSSISATTMLSAAQNGATQTWRISFYATQTAVGVACTGNTTVQTSVIFQDPNAASAQTVAIPLFTVTTTGTIGQVPWTSGPMSYTFRSKIGTAIQFSTTYTLGAGCTTGPAVQVFPVLEAL